MSTRDPAPVPNSLRKRQGFMDHFGLRNTGVYGPRWNYCCCTRVCRMQIFASVFI